MRNKARQNRKKGRYYPQLTCRETETIRWYKGNDLKGDDDSSPYFPLYHSRKERIISEAGIGTSISGTMIQDTIQSKFHTERLMKAWRIDKKTALKTIRATTQRYKRKRDPKMTRNSSTHDKATRYHRINDHLFMDTMFATSKGGKSVRGNICAQIFTTDRGFIAAYPLQSKSQVKQAIRLFCKEVGVPSTFIGDQSNSKRYL